MRKHRGDMIRTCDPFVPNEVLYQAELRPGVGLEPFKIASGFPAMTIRATDLALLKLLSDTLPAVFRHHATHIILFPAVNMIELQHNWIRFAAIHASFVR